MARCIVWWTHRSLLYPLQHIITVAVLVLVSKLLKTVENTLQQSLSGGTGYTRYDTFTIAGNNVGGAATTNDITVTVVAVDTNGVILEIERNRTRTRRCVGSC